jgi:hypothetical protein
LSWSLLGMHCSIIGLCAYISIICIISPCDVGFV